MSQPSSRRNKASVKTSWIPRTPASKAKMSSIPRLSAHSPMLQRKQALGIARRSIMSPSPTGDRFIPNRAKMNMELCQASVATAEKRRLDAIGTAAARRRRRINGDDIDTPPRTTQTELETPLQVEFRRRMKAAMFDVPFDRFEVERPHSATLRTSTRSRTVDPNYSSNSFLDPYDISHLAYASIPELEAGTPSRRVINESSLMSIGNANRPSGVASSTPVPDPYEQDRLHVLQRSAAKSSYGRMLSTSGDDPSSDLQSSIVRRFPTEPTRTWNAPDLVWDAPGLVDISWSEDNVLAIALQRDVCIWNPKTGKLQHVTTLPGQLNLVTSVAWVNLQGTRSIAVGTTQSAIQLLDPEARERIGTLRGQRAAVSALCCRSATWLTSGGQNGFILNHDMRAPNTIVSRWKGHDQEVCSLKWNKDGTTLASGGMDNLMCIWDVSRTRPARSEDTIEPRLVFTQHKAPVKALAWYPFEQGILTSGDTADRTIKFWNTNNGKMLNSVDTESPVCSLLWSKHQRELVSSQGFSENHFTLWNYPSMTKVQEFKGHPSRVLNMDMSPDGQIVSAAADETLQFWDDIFGRPAPSCRVPSVLEMGHGPGMSTIR